MSAHLLTALVVALEVLAATQQAEAVARVVVQEQQDRSD
jgi:hypothetical protein